MGELFQCCSVKTGQRISKKRQLKKFLMKKLGVTGKRLRALQKQAIRTGDRQEMFKYGVGAS